MGTLVAPPVPVSALQVGSPAVVMAFRWDAAAHATDCTPPRVEAVGTGKRPAGTVPVVRLVAFKGLDAVRAVAIRLSFPSVAVAVALPYFTAKVLPVKVRPAPAV